jgi:hypothetical protein
MYCRCTWLLFYSAFATKWLSTSMVLIIGMVRCHGCLGNTCYPSVFLLKIHHYRTVPVPRHVRIVYSQHKLGFGCPWVWTVACYCCMLYFLLSGWNDVTTWFGRHCLLHFVTGLNERDVSVPINNVIVMLNYNSCCCFDWSVFYCPVIPHYECVTISEHFVPYLCYFFYNRQLWLYCTLNVWQFSVSYNTLGPINEITYHCLATVQYECWLWYWLFMRTVIHDVMIQFLVLNMWFIDINCCYEPAISS